MHKRKLLDINDIFGISVAGIVFELFFLMAEYYMLYLRDDSNECFFSSSDDTVVGLPVFIIMFMFMLLVILLGVGFYIICYSLIGLVLTLIKYYYYYYYYVDKDKDKKI